MKEGPASMLRTMFAGFGSLMSVMDRRRSKSAAAAPAAAGASAPEATVSAAAVPEAATEPETAVEPETTAEPETVVAETITEWATAEPEATVEAEAAGEPETVVPETITEWAASALPLANYDELSVASLRARLRNLSVEQLAQLIAYEKGHAARPDVISMFERRIAKVESEA